MTHLPTLSRRGLLLGGTGLVLGCGHPTRNDPPVHSATAPVRSAAAPPPLGAPPPPAPANSGCLPTPDNIEGPFYKAGAPLRSQLYAGPGRRLVVEGRVLDARCAPVPGATLDVWQADAEGRYDNAGFGLRGRFTTDAAGSYRLETVWPGHYLNGDRYRPAHIHVKVAGPGLRPLTTQLYFEGDPHNAGDPFIDRSLIMPVTGEAGDGLHRAGFDLVLPRLA